MTTIRLQTSAMKAKRARNARAQRRSLASAKATLPVGGRRQSTPLAQSIATVKTKKITIRIPGPKKANASAQAASPAKPKKLMIRIPGFKKANVAPQTASAGKVEVEESADAASVILAQTSQYKPTRLRFTPGKPAVMV